MQALRYDLQHVDATDNTHAPFRLKPDRKLTLAVELRADPSAGWEDDDLKTERWAHAPERAQMIHGHWAPPSRDERDAWERKHLLEPEEEPTLLGPDSAAFELERPVQRAEPAITPAPDLTITNVCKVVVRAGEAYVFDGASYPRVLLAGDWG